MSEIADHTELTVLRYKIADQVYDILKAQITKGIFVPGEEILIDQITKRLNTSKTPIREALNRLKGEGLVLETNRGRMSVIELSSEEIAHLCDLRAALETLALKWGFKNIPRETLQENLRMLKQAKKDLEKGDSESFRKADAILHDLIVTSAGNKWLVQVISQLGNLIEMTKNIYTSLERYRECLQDHIGIVESLLKGDRDSAVRNLNSDIENVKRQLVASLQQKDRRDTQS